MEGDEGETKEKLHNRFRERRIPPALPTPTRRNSFQHWLFTCIRFSISIYNAACLHTRVGTRSPRAENGFSWASPRRGVDLHGVLVLTDRSCGSIEVCIPSRDAFLLKLLAVRYSFLGDDVGWRWFCNSSATVLGRARGSTSFAMRCM